MSTLPPPRRDRTWRSGPWSIQRRDDEFAEVRWRGRRVLRSVRAVVRDRYWRTVDLDVVSVSGTVAELTVAVRSRGEGSDIRGFVTVRVDHDEISFHWEAESHAAFWTNRTGLVVLHPAAVTGADLRIHHIDGSLEAAAFPRDIAPHQPALDVAGLTWSDDGLEIEAAFAGDVFEMEDQRNWTDASFKTYGRPLALPAPYLLARGARLSQSVTLRVRERHRPAPVRRTDRIALSRGGRFPAVMTAASTPPAPHRVAPVGDELIVDLDLADDDWRATVVDAARSGLPLDVRLAFSAQSESAVEAALALLGSTPVARAAAFHSTGPTCHLSDEYATRVLRDALARIGRRISVVGGSRAHFTELNRGRESLSPGLDGIVFASTPLHHTDTLDQLVESVAIQRMTALQAVRLAGDLPVRVGPVTLRPRFVDGAGGADRIPPADDRIDSAWMASWVIASAAAFGVPGVDAVCFFEESGPRGLHRDDGSPRPVAEAVRVLAGTSGGLLWGDSPDGSVWAFGAAEEDGMTVFAANLDREPRSVELSANGAATRVLLPPFGWRRTRLPRVGAPPI